MVRPQGKQVAKGAEKQLTLVDSILFLVLILKKIFGILICSRFIDNYLQDKYLLYYKSKDGVS